MGTRRHAVGTAMRMLDTPVLLVDLPTMRANMTLTNEKLDRLKRAHPYRLRPHMKAHKSLEIARLQTSMHGSRLVGICCQKLVEAEVAVMGGVKDVLITNEIVGAQ